MLLLASAMLAGAAAAAEFVSIEGAACSPPPYLKCPDENCPGDRVINQGPVVEMATRRPFFLDYPCDLKPGEDVTLVLSTAGSRRAAGGARRGHARRGGGRRSR
jgi:hypothetical protein